MLMTDRKPSVWLGRWPFSAFHSKKIHFFRSSGKEWAAIFELMRCFSTLSSTFPFFLRCSCGWSSDFFILRQGWNSRRLHLFVLPSSHFYFCCGPDLSIRMPTSTHDLAPLRISLFHYKNDSRSRFFPLKMKIGVSFLGGRNLFGLRSAIHYEPPPINQTNTHGMLRINSRKTSCRWFDSIINIRCRWKKRWKFLPRRRWTRTGSWRNIPRSWLAGMTTLIATRYRRVTKNKVLNEPVADVADRHIHCATFRWLSDRCIMKRSAPVICLQASGDDSWRWHHSVPIHQRPLLCAVVSQGNERRRPWFD